MNVRLEPLLPVRLGHLTGSSKQLRSHFRPIRLLVLSTVVGLTCRWCSCGFCNVAAGVRHVLIGGTLLPDHTTQPDDVARNADVGQDATSQQLLTEEERDVLKQAETRSDKSIYVISDNTGETAKLLVTRLLVQYPNVLPEVVVYGNIRTPEQIVELMAEAQEAGDVLLFSTFVNPEMIRWMDKLASEQKLQHIAVMPSLLSQFSIFLDGEAEGKPGVPTSSVNRTRIRDRVAEAYIGMVDAVKYAQQHVSGLNSQGWAESDVVLIGASRVGKAAHAYMLSERGLKVACVDLVPEEGLPTELKAVDPSKIQVIYMAAEALSLRRKGRINEFKSKNMMSLLDPDYADPVRVEEEVAFVQSLIDQHQDWLPALDCTHLAVEDSSANIARSIRDAKRRQLDA